METVKMIKELRRLEEKHENDRVGTFENNWSAMCHDVANRLEEQENELEKLKSGLAEKTKNKYRLHYSSADDTNDAIVEMTDDEAEIVKRVLEEGNKQVENSYVGIIEVLGKI